MELVLHNRDLVTEILLWLPAESIVKFQSASKELFSLISSLISSTEFRQQHTIRGLKPQHQSLILQTSGLPKHTFHLNPTSRRLTSLCLSLPADDDIILQSSNGLLLLRPRCVHYMIKHLYVQNPATKQSRKIVIPTRPAKEHTVVDVADFALAFNPSESPYYKLVYVRRAFNEHEWEESVRYQIEVYSSESHTWNEELILEPFSLPTSMRVSLSCFVPERVRVYWNNAVYWSSKRGPLYCSFDLAKGEMKTLSFPASPDHLRDGKGIVFRQYNDGHDYSCLQESNGHLFHVELMGSIGACRMVAVWELDDDDRWLLRHHHVLPPPPQWVAKWKRPRILTFLVDTCSVLICWNGWMRFFSLKFGSYEDFLHATGHPFFQKDYKAYLHLMVLEFGGTLALV